jgi:mannan endo-1,6-alpha-mannosidase
MLTPVLEASAKAAAAGCSTNGENVRCQLRWTKQGDGSTGLGESFSALAVAQALLVPQAKALATSSSANGTSGNSTHPGAGGSAQPKDHEGGAGALYASRGVVVVAAVVAVAFL